MQTDAGAADLSTTSADDMAPASDDLATVSNDLAQTDLAPPGMVTLQGAAAKGPLILGSPVDVSPTDATGHPTGAIFQTSTAADGTFSVQMPDAPLVQIKATGYYYNEMTGQVSGSTLDLFALLDGANVGQMSHSVNLFTHLAFKRIQALLATMSLSTATTTAETELKGQLRIGGSFDPGVPGAQMSMVGGDNDGSAWLFSLSAIFVRAAMIENAGPVEGVLQSLLNTVQSDVIASGVVDASTLGYVARGQACVRPTDVMSKLAAYFSTIGASATVPNINRALDTDLDGVPNLTDSCLRIANPVSGGSQPAVTDQVCSSAVTQSSTATVPASGTAFTRSGDLDGNGAADVVAVVWSGQTQPSSLTAASWLNPGASPASAPVITDLASRLGLSGRSIKLVQAQVGDLDGDGHADLALSYRGTSTSPTLAYLPGDGAGGFGAPVVISAGTDPYLCGNGYCTGSTPYCSGGTCVVGCGNGPPCASGYSCVSGQCQQNCPTSPCSVGTTCVGGTSCQVQCGSNICTASQTCDYFFGTCLNGNCWGKTCAAGQYCDDMTCTSQGCGLGPPCTNGTACVSDFFTGQFTCRPTCGSVVCQPPNGYCDRTTLQCAPGCDDQTPCAPGTICTGPLGPGSKGACYLTCGTGYCDTGETCTNNSCSCGNNSLANHFWCTPGTSSCVDGVCRPDSACGPGSVCPTNGDVCVYGVCTPATFPGILDFQLADIDGSGRLSIVGTEVPQLNGVNYPDPHRTANLVVIKQTAGGVFSMPTVVAATAQTSVDAVDVRAADVDGDGRAEALVSAVDQSGTFSLQLLANDGAGNFAPAPVAALAGPWSGRVTFALGDVDGDGHRDIAVLSAYNRTGGPVVTVAFGDGAGGFPAEITLTQAMSSAYQYSDCSDAKPKSMAGAVVNGELSLGDVNGDGKADVFLGGLVYLSTGRGFGLGGPIEGDLAGTSSTRSYANADPIITGPRMFDVDGNGHGAVVDSHFTGSTSVALGVGRVNPSGVHTW